MKKNLSIIFFCFICLLCFSEVPKFEDGHVITITEFSEKLKDNITVTNFSTAAEIEFEFFAYKDSDWKPVGRISKCPFGTEMYLLTTFKFRKVEYIAYKTNLSSNQKVFADIRNQDLKLFVLESTETLFGSTTSFEKITVSTENGIYKFDTTEQQRRYEDNLRVERAPTCLIMFQSPEYGVWDVYATVMNGKIKALYHDDIDNYAPYWVIKILDEHKLYNISAYARNDDLYFKFIKTDTQ